MKKRPKYGGRKKGTPNKVTAETREFILSLINAGKETALQDLAQLDPKDRLMILERLVNYVLPKQQSISLEAQIEAEYAYLLQLIDEAPDEAIEAITEKIIKIADEKN